MKSMIKAIFTSIRSANFMLIQTKIKIKELQEALENWQETGNDFFFLAKVCFSLDRTSQFTALFQIHDNFPVSY